MLRQPSCIVLSTSLFILNNSKIQRQKKCKTLYINYIKHFITYNNHLDFGITGFSIFCQRN